METNSNKGQEYLLRLSSAVYRVTERFPEEEPLCFLIRERALLILENVCILSLDGNPGSLNLKSEDKEAIYQELIVDIEVLKYYLRIAGEQEWVNKENFSVLLREYQALQRKVKESWERFQRESQQGLQNKNLSSGLKDATTSPDSLETERGTADLNKEGATASLGVESKKEKQIKIKLSQFENPRHRKILRILSQNEKAQLGQIKKFFPQVTKRTLRRDFNELLAKGWVEREGEGKATFYRLKENVSLF